jgi:hypothetical protein
VVPVSLAAAITRHSRAEPIGLIRAATIAIGRITSSPSGGGGSACTLANTGQACGVVDARSLQCNSWLDASA